MRTIRAVCLVLILGTWSLSARGQDQSVVATARQLAKEGLSAYDAGRYDEAAQKLMSAYQAVRVPTFARNAARALVKKGKLVAASEVYLEATRLTPNELWRGELQQQAQREAAEERAVILPRIADLKITLDGAAAHETQVTLDDAVVPEALVDTGQFVDPGLHRVVAKHGAQTVKGSVELKESEHKELVLRFEPVPAAPAVQPQPVVGPVVAPVAQLPTPASVPQQERGASNTQHTLGWVGIGVGAAGVTVGAVTGIMALVKRSQLHDAGCVSNNCYNHQVQDKMDSYNSLLPVSSVGFIAGAVVAAAGVTLLLWPEPRESRPNVGVLVGPSSLAVRGRF